MHIGGVLIGAGMELDLAPGDYQFGENRIRFLIEQVVDVHRDWIVVDGTARPTPVLPWQPMRLQIRVDALKQSLTLL